MAEIIDPERQVFIEDIQMPRSVSGSTMESFEVTYTTHHESGVFADNEDTCGPTPFISQGWNVLIEVNVFKMPEGGDVYGWRDTQTHCIGPFPKDDHNFWVTVPDTAGRYLVTVVAVYEGSGDPLGSVQFDLTVSDDDPDPTHPWESDEWKTVPNDEPLEVGDTYRTLTCITVPDIPGDELIAKFSIAVNDLTGQLNNELPPGFAGEVIDTQLHEVENGVAVGGQSCHFIYVTEFRLTKVPEGAELTTQGFHAALIAAVAALLVLAGISLALWRTEKLLETPGGEQTVDRISLAVLLGVGAYALSTADDAFGFGDDDENSAES